MIIHDNIKSVLKEELAKAKTVWVASAMISKGGLKFIQDQLPADTIQYYLIGIDLNTEPEVFEKLFANPAHNARIYRSKYTYHPKVYLIRSKEGTLTALIGSSNTTIWGLEKNVEMNFLVNDQNECQKLLDWFNKFYTNGHIITPAFIESYKASFVKVRSKTKEIDNELVELKMELSENSGQFFSLNQHRIFNEKYHRLENQDLKKIRTEVREKFLQLHRRIYPRFATEGLINLSAHHQKREWVSRHFFNRYSGYYINAIWLHYGKSQSELTQYDNGDQSINNPGRFINNIRLQVIIHEHEIGIWLMLGRGGASIKDREHLKIQLQDLSFRTAFYVTFKKLGVGYWINASAPVGEADINNADELATLILESRDEDYFIIGRNIGYLDPLLSDDNIANTVIEAFKKLYELYELIRHR